MTKKQFIGISLILLIAGFIWFFSNSTDRKEFLDSAETVYISGTAELLTAKNKHILRIEIADTPATWQQGLMFRKSWGDAQGMLFIFNKEEPLDFWMKNTHLPLDILFFDADGHIANIALGTTPLSQTLIPSLLPAKYVLEIPAGKADSLGLDDTTTLNVNALAGEAP